MRTGDKEMQPRRVSLASAKQSVLIGSATATLSHCVCCLPPTRLVAHASTISVEEGALRLSDAWGWLNMQCESVAVADPISTLCFAEAREALHLFWPFSSFNSIDRKGWSLRGVGRSNEVGRSHYSYIDAHWTVFIPSVLPPPQNTLYYLLKSALTTLTMNI